MQNLTELFDLINRKQFLIKYAGINPEAGINHRFTGKGTNDKDKKKGLTPEDISSIKAGLEKFEGEIREIREGL